MNAGPENGDAVTVAYHLGRALEQDEELVGELTLAHQLLALRQIDLVRPLSHLAQLPGRERLEPRCG